MHLHFVVMQVLAPARVLAEFEEFDACCKGAVVNGELTTGGGQC